MIAAPRTRKVRNQRRLCWQAVRACNAAEFTAQAGRCFNINDLPDDQGRAAHALLYAAVAHYLAASKPPKTLHWQGRRWYLTPLDSARLQVAAWEGHAGLVSMPGVLA